MRNKNTINAIGVMSGTSLDGLDIAAVKFEYLNEKWRYELQASKTFSYPKEWEEKLRQAPELKGEELTALDSSYGSFIGEQVKNFLLKTNFAPDLIASHGHTIFHHPEKSYTLQIGNGAFIAAATNQTTVTDFRTGDVALGGQGAPLVPIGDRLLFAEYKHCLNLGGFANISFEKDGKRVAFDICPVNFILNLFAKEAGLPFDKNGELGKKGKVDSGLLNHLNQILYYQSSPPKSLGREWVEQEFLPVLNQSGISNANKIRTVYEHIALQIGRTIGNNGETLLTGGGAFNTFLVKRLKATSNVKFIIPPEQIINFKEAIIFAFLGVLRINNCNNCLASVTGAQSDSCGGIVYNATKPPMSQA